MPTLNKRSYLVMIAADATGINLLIRKPFPSKPFIIPKPMPNPQVHSNKDSTDAANTSSAPHRAATLAGNRLGRRGFYAGFPPLSGLAAQQPWTMPWLGLKGEIMQIFHKREKYREGLEQNGLSRTFLGEIKKN